MTSTQAAMANGKWQMANREPKASVPGQTELTVKEAAAWLGESVRTVDRLIERRLLACRGQGQGGRRRIPIQSLEEYKAAKTVFARNLAAVLPENSWGQKIEERVRAVERGLAELRAQTQTGPTVRTGQTTA